MQARVQRAPAMIAAHAARAPSCSTRSGRWSRSSLPLRRSPASLRERHGVEVTPADATRALRAEMAHYRRNCIRAADADSLAALRLECAALVGRELGGPLAALDARRARADAAREHPLPRLPRGAGGARTPARRGLHARRREQLGRLAARRARAHGARSCCSTVS